jgi:hypothetical protein
MIRFMKTLTIYNLDKVHLHTGNTWNYVWNRTTASISSKIVKNVNFNAIKIWDQVGFIIYENINR